MPMPTIKTFHRPAWLPQFCLQALAFALALIWMEICVKIWDFRSIWNDGLLYTALFSLSITAILFPLFRLGAYRTNRCVTLIVLGVLTFVYLLQAVYFTVMKTVFAVYSVSVATNATEYWRVALLGIWRSLPILLPIVLPFVCFCVFSKHLIADSRGNWQQAVRFILASMVLYGMTLLMLALGPIGSIASRWEIYLHRTNPELTLSQFGVLTSLRLDMQHLLTTPKEKKELPAPDNKIPVVSVENPQVLAIDFAALADAENDEELKQMHRYFAANKPSGKNSYTGRFAGKNLIMITAEAFSSWAVDEELTPTLYRLSREGFVFENFYTPLWWMSTTDGEYVSCTSLIPQAGTHSFSQAADNSLPFCMGNQLRANGYETQAYHNHTYDYYERDKTHPNMGYAYQGVGNGLDMVPTKMESDLEMMEETLPNYIDKTPFHTYYMTVSGHLSYNFDTNDMAKKHRAQVSQLPLSEEAQAYLACQMELDRALAHLLQQLEAAGQLENTVICLYPDHYPYGLSDKTLEELGGEGIRDGLDLYRSTMILWSGDMKEPVGVKKPCSNLDILPTLSNLFAVPYDSRLLMGRDILSDDPGLVIFNDSSFVTEQGSYSAKKDVFTPAPGVTVENDYAKRILQEVRDKFLYSTKILQRDYYRVLGLPKDQTE